MRNMVIFYRFRWYEVFLKLHVIIIIRFGENNVFGPIYLNFCVWLDKWCTLHCSFAIHKIGKITRTWPIIKTNSTSFSPNMFFSRVNNKKVSKRGGLGPGPHNFFQEVSIVVFTDNIVILITPGFCSAVYNGIGPIASNLANIQSSEGHTEKFIFCWSKLNCREISGLQAYVFLHIPCLSYQKKCKLGKMLI